MPQVAQFQLPQPGQQPQPAAQLPAGAPAVMQFQLPNAQSQSGQNTSPGNIYALSQHPQTPAQSAQNTEDLGKGLVKSVISTGMGAAQAGETIANQTAGRAVNAIEGNGFNPLSGNQLGNDIGNPNSPAGQKASLLAKPSNDVQREGETIGNIGQAFLPTGEVSDAIEASQVSKIPGIAKSLAAPKATLGTVAKGLMSLGENSGITRDAKAIEPLVKSGALKAGDDAKTVANNVASLKNEISKSAEGLIAHLKGMEIQPTVQPEELTEIFKRQLASIDKNVPPSGQAAAKETAQWIWQKFINNLPKGKEITPEDLLGARKATDAEIESIKGQNVFDPATENGFTAALRSYRQGANDLLETKAPGSKNALSYQSSLYNVLENVAKKGAGAVKKAEEVANTPGIKGLIAQNPIKAGIVGAAGTAALEGAGLGAYNKYFGGVNQ